MNFISFLLVLLLGLIQVWISVQKAAAAEEARQLAVTAQGAAEKANGQAQSALKEIREIRSTVEDLVKGQTLLSDDKSQRYRIQKLASEAMAMGPQSRGAYEELKRISQSTAQPLSTRNDARQSLEIIRKQYWMPRALQHQIDPGKLPPGTKPCAARSFLNSADPDVRIAALSQISEMGDFWRNRELITAIVQLLVNDQSLKVLDFIGEREFGLWNHYIELGTTLEPNVAAVRARLASSVPKCEEK